jgi:hypothetical protein
MLPVGKLWRIGLVRPLGGLVASVLVAACGGPDEPVDAATLERVAATDGQTAPAGAMLPDPLAVQAQSAGGEVVPRAAVRWTITQGTGAALSDTVTLADGTGRAQVALTLGPASGAYGVRAQLRDHPDAAQAFHATATAAPALTSVTPSTFRGGDTLTLSGTDLAAAADVEVGGAPARVLSGGAAALTVVAPVCLVPGSVNIRARVAGATSNPLSATYQASGGVLALAVGDYASIDPAQLDAGCATFPDAGPGGAEYLVAPQSTGLTPAVTAIYRLQGNQVVGSVVAAPPPPAAEVPLATRFHDLLRAQEAAAAALPRSPAPALSVGGAQATERISVGDERSFQVCTQLPCTSASQFSSVAARARYVGVHAAIFVDNQAPADFTPQQYDSLGVMFDQDLYEVDTRAFGAESDIDANGVVIILFTAAVNRLTPRASCASSIITGYFFGVDIDPLFQHDARSNRGEAFYAMTPDPQGSVSCPLAVDVVLRLVPVTFIHEFQHMISYYQHVVVRGANAEVLWLNEGMSHLAEELGGLHFDAQGNGTLFSRFALGDLYNAYSYLRQTGSQPLLGILGHGSLEERGAAWLFARWLVDQYGTGLTRRLLETSQTGAENVSAAVGVPFPQLAAQWFLANYVSDLPGFTAPPRLRYGTWQLRTTYQSLFQQLPSTFPEPFPINPPQFSGGMAAAAGTLHAGSGDYLLVTLQANQAGFTLVLDDGAGGPVSPTVVPRLDVIRLR